VFYWLIRSNALAVTRIIVMTVPLNPKVAVRLGKQHAHV